MEDRFPVLDGGHPPGGEGSVVADPIDLVDDGNSGVAGAEEVGVQGVNRTVHPSAVFNRPAGRDQRLSGYLASEHPESLLVRAESPVEVDFQWFKVEEVEELVQGRRHPTILPADSTPARCGKIFACDSRIPGYPRRRPASVRPRGASAGAGGAEALAVLGGLHRRGHRE